MAEDPLDPAALGHEPHDPGDPADPADEREADDQPLGALEVAPVVARLAAGAAWRGAGWTFASYVRGMNWLTRAALSDESTAELLNEARAGVRRQARSLLGFDEIEQRVYGGGERNGGSLADDEGEAHPLRDRGRDLLERSADVELAEGEHPAYEQILDQLAPDEGRILRLLATKGPRPAVDVKTWRPLGVGSQTVAPGLSMIGAEAGCTHSDRVPAYLNNLFRLGLIWFSREQLEDTNVYQLLEVQPDVLEAMRRAGRASTVRRSIRLTPFGVDFCETCIPLTTFSRRLREDDPPPPGAGADPALGSLRAIGTEPESRKPSEDGPGR